MKSDYAIIHKNWNGIEIEIRWNADYLAFDDGRSLAHLEVQSIKPPRAPLPITETGYRSHFIEVDEVENFGGPASYVDAWFHDITSRKPVRSGAAQSPQLSLF